MNRPRVLFHLSTPPGALPGTDAVVQEVEAIRRHLGGGRVLHLYPSEKPGTRIPRLVWGLQHLRRLAALEHDVDLHHVFNPDPFPFAVLSRLKRPIVYSAVAGLGTGPWYRVKRLGRQVACLTVPTEPDRLRLGDLGLDRTAVIPPGIDWYRFEPTPPPPEAPFVLLAGSAPWTTEQFESKGVNALLAAAQREPDLHLVFLWRGLLADEMRRRVAAAGLDKRVRVLDHNVDVAEVLAESHAALVLAARPLLVRDFPHSLLEALAAGRPVLVSPTLAMSRFVSAEGCGEIVDEVTPESVLESIARLRENYHQLRRSALRIPGSSFSLRNVVETHDRIYREILGPEATTP